MKILELKKSDLALTLLSLVWLVMCSIMTVFKYAPEALNADILINSVMSLQNVTLYYWGQNRLLNILPFVTSIIQNPMANLVAVLLMTSSSFFLFLFVLSKILTRAIGNTHTVSVKLFIILSSLFLILSSGGTISGIVLGHIEYSFPALLVSIVFYITWFGKGGRYRWAFIASILLMIAIGMNPSTLLPIIFIVFSAVIYEKKINFRYIVIASVSITSFIFWGYISNMYGKAPYNKFVVQQIPEAVGKIVTSLMNTFDLNKLFFILGIYLLFWLTQFVVKSRNVFDFTAVQRYTVAATFAFSIGWLFLFSASTWVEMNQYAWRYFTYIIFACLVVAGFYILTIVKHLGSKANWLLAFLMFVTATESIYRKPVSFFDYDIFKRVNELSPESHALYAGDYWVVWPAVLRDLMLGKPSLGLAYRAEGNVIKVNEYILAEIEKNGYFSVRCLNDTVENCTNQIRNVVNVFVAPIFILDVLNTQNKMFDIKITDNVSQLIYKRELLSLLPGTFEISTINRVYSAGEIKQLSYGLVEKQSFNNNVLVKFKIFNTSSLSISSFSSIGNPMRISWRFLDSAGKPVTGWDHRKALPFDIPANDHLDLTITIQPEQEVSGGILQISMVQEGVFWAHDIGVKPLEIIWD